MHFKKPHNAQLSLDSNLSEFIYKVHSNISAIHYGLTYLSDRYNR